MTDILKVAVLQYDIEWLNIEKNLEKVESLCSQIQGEIDIFFLPEMFATGFTVSPEEIDRKSQNIVFDRLNAIAKKYQAVFTGSHPFFENGEFYNRMFFIAPGSADDFYNKRHLFSIGEENHKYQCGTERKIFEYKGWRLMPQICYDLRFPVWSRNNLNYDLLYYSANWPSVRNYAWELLLKARAIENQCYVIGINRIGKDGRDLSYIGNSQVISVNGEIIENAGDQEKVIIVTLQKELMTRFRQSFPILNDMDSFRIEN